MLGRRVAGFEVGGFGFCNALLDGSWPPMMFGWLSGGLVVFSFARKRLQMAFKRCRRLVSASGVRTPQLGVLIGGIGALRDASSASNQLAPLILVHQLQGILGRFAKEGRDTNGLELQFSFLGVGVYSANFTVCR